MSITLSNLTISNVSASTSGATPPPSGDPYWSSVTLLTETTSVNGATNNTFLDGSSNARTIFTSGTVAQGSFSPFAVANGSSYSPATNGGSGYFVNGDVYIVNGPYNVAGNFTAECWFYRTGTGAGLQYIFAEQGSGNYFGVQSSGAVFGAINGNMLFSDGAQVVTIGAWHHLVLVRSGSNVAAFVDGARVATATSSAAFQYQFIGGVTTGSFSSNAYGYLSDCRIVNSAVYNPSNTTITVPTAPLTAITGTQLLMNFTNAGVYDAAAKGNMFTIGSAQVSTAQKKFGTSSAYFNASAGTRMSEVNSANFGYGTGDFTVEFWTAIASSTGTAQVLLDQRTAEVSMAAPVIYVDDAGTLYYFLLGANAIVAASAIVGYNTWYHVAISRSSGSTKMFVNGTQVSSTLSDTNNYGSSLPLAIGASWQGNAPMSGYVQDVRITKGVARYTANFTAPTAAFPTN